MQGQLWSHNYFGEQESSRVASAFFRNRQRNFLQLSRWRLEAHGRDEPVAQQRASRKITYAFEHGA